MAVIIGSTFRPFEYQELLAPVQQATQAHKELENAYGELDTKAGVWEGLANQQTDPVAYNTYKKYSEDLRQKADMLASQGLSADTRRSMNEMKARYASEIVPIEMAYKRRDELSKEQREYMMKNPTAIFDRDMSVTSLDEMIGNPTLQYRSLSGRDIMAQVSEQAKNLARQVREDPATWKSILGDQYYEMIRNTGFKDSEVLDAIMNNPNAQPVLQKILDDTIASTGVTSWGNQAALEAVRGYAGQGLWSAIGTEDRKQLQNRYWDYAMKKKDEQPGAPQIPFRRRPLAKVEVEESTTEMKRDLELIKEAAKDPSKLKKALSQSTGSGSGPLATFQHPGVNSDHYNAMQKWSKITGSTDPTVIEDYINREIRNSAKLYADDIYTPADNKFLVKTISDNLKALRDADAETPLVREYNPRKREVGSDYKTFADVRDYLNESTVLALDHMDNIVITGENEKGKSKSFALDPALFDTSIQGPYNMSNIVSLLRRAREIGDPELYMSTRESIFSILNSMNNDYAKVQGTTLGQKDAIPGEESYLNAIINP